MATEEKVIIAGREFNLKIDSNVTDEEKRALLASMEERADSPVRKLSKREQELYSSACRTAVSTMPPFRDAVALMRPFFDLTAGTAYTDRFARVGLSPWFFFLGNVERATVVLHECMHVLNNHIIRFEGMGFSNHKISNIAGDFEINSGLAMMGDKVDLGSGILPDKEPFFFPNNKSMEQYYQLVSDWAEKEKNKEKEELCECGGSEENEGGNSGEQESNGGVPQNEEPPKCPDCGKAKASQGDGNSSTSGNSDPLDLDGACDENTEERAEAADEAGIEKASDAEKSIAKRNTSVRIVDELKQKSLKAGSSAYYDFLELAYLRMTPPKVSWQSIFRLVLSRLNENIARGKSDYSYRRTNRRMHNSKFIYPGMVQYNPSLYFGIDTSGSMSTADYNALLSEIEAIIKTIMRSKNSFKVFTIDMDIKSVKPVNSVKQVKLEGGGGTDMAAGVRFVNSLKPKETPDIFVLATDGGTDWRSYEKALLEGKGRYNHILLVTDANGYASVPDGIKKLCKVIDISPEK